MKSNYRKALLTFELKVRRREFSDSYAIACNILNLFQNAIKKVSTPEEIKLVFNDLAQQLQEHFPYNVMINNVCSILKARLNEQLEEDSRIKDTHSKKSVYEYPFSQSISNDLNKTGEVSIERRQKGNDFFDRSKFIPKSHSKSFLNMLVFQNASTPKTSEVESDGSNNPPEASLKIGMLEEIDLLYSNLTASYKSIAKNASSFLFPHDIVLTLGYSKTILDFISESHANFTIFVTERAPEYDGLKMAEELKQTKNNVIVIPDSAVFAVLPKVSKIIIPVFSVLANGGVVSYSLSHSVALAAKHYSTPFIALYWSLKLTDRMPLPGKFFTTLHQPSQIFRKTDPTVSNVVAMNIEYDYIPPELITLFINEEGAHSTADVFNLVLQMYGEDE
ncbi:Translation initiation factor eIF-2B subunit beta [Tritrichomonas musculus]|uniref:Translation initiation factor eIF2B subunit beta n=1 Tax=Tritrichomonas musculus TaxID=1915356 RepID=A0ABR2IL72_9EUKA